MNSQERDIECGYNFNRLLELGCFDKEFVAAGYCFFDEGEICYRVGENMLNIWQEYKRDLLRGAYPTEIRKIVKRTMVPSGQENTIKQKVKIDLAMELRNIYSREFFQIINETGSVQNINTAYPLLKEMQEEIDGHFSDSELQMFAGFCEQALISKTLEYNQYFSFKQWLKKTRKQMADDVQAADNMKRVFSGFAYFRNQDELRYYADAEQQSVHEKAQAYQKQGFIVTPIYTKVYWFKNISEISTVRKKFQAELKDIMTCRIIKTAQSLQMFHNPYVCAKYKAASEQIKQRCTEKASETFEIYGRAWHCLSK